MDHAETPHDAGPHRQQVADALGVGFCSHDLDGGTAFWDAQMYRIHRRPPEDGPPGFDDWIEQHVHPDDRAWVREQHRRASQNWEPVVEATFRSAGADGGERWIQSWTRRAWRDGRRVAFGMHLDVTDRERAQAQPRRERERTQFAIEAAEVGVWERALDGHVTYWNDAMYRLRGLDPKDPRPPDQIVAATTHPEDHATAWAGVDLHLREGRPYRYEARVRQPDGRWRWLVTQGRALRDAEGRVFGMAGINLDITERKVADELRLQKERAEQASRDKTAFMARLSHELRTPMNAVLGFTQLLGSDPVEPPTARQRDKLQRISEAGERMMALIDDLLDLAGADHGPAPPAEPLLLADLLPQVQQMLAGLARRLGVMLHVPSGQAAPAVLADRRRLVQALVHLAGHALRRQPAPGMVLLEAAAVADGGQVQIVVRDHGPAYRDDERAGLFDPFLRSGDIAAAPADTGLGLAVAQRLLQSMGGSVAARAAEGGHGNEFVLRLPAAPPTAAPERRPLLVLCVEDNPVNLTLVRELVALRGGITLLEAVNGASGLAAAREHRPDVLLLDLQLPDISGIELLRRLREDPLTHDSVCIALSANAMPDQVAAARAAGFDDYWTKPIDVPAFLAGLERYGASRSRTQPGASPSPSPAR